MINKNIFNDIEIVIWFWHLAIANSNVISFTQHIHWQIENATTLYHFWSYVQFDFERLIDFWIYILVINALFVSILKSIVNLSGLIFKDLDCIFISCTLFDSLNLGWFIVLMILVFNRNCNLLRKIIFGVKRRQKCNILDTLIHFIGAIILLTRKHYKIIFSNSTWEERKIKHMLPLVHFNSILFMML